MAEETARLVVKEKVEADLAFLWEDAKVDVQTQAAFANKWLRGITPAHWARFADYLLGDRVCLLKVASVEGVSVAANPPWPVLLSYEYECRKWIYKRIREGTHSLAAALDDVVTNSELREIFFISPLDLLLSNRPSTKRAMERVPRTRRALPRRGVTEASRKFGGRCADLFQVDNFNGTGYNNPQCPRAHACRICLGEHSMQACPKAAQAPLPASSWQVKPKALSHLESPVMYWARMTSSERGVSLAHLPSLDLASTQIACPLNSPGVMLEAETKRFWSEHDTCDEDEDGIPRAKREDFLGLCSPGRWAPGQRKKRNPFISEIAEGIIKILRERHGDLNRLCLQLAVGKFRDGSPFESVTVEDAR
eukprot:992641-Amphidinium_carterae.1